MFSTRSRKGGKAWRPSTPLTIGLLCLAAAATACTPTPACPHTCVAGLAEVCQRTPGVEKLALTPPKRRELSVGGHRRGHIGRGRRGTAVAGWWRGGQGPAMVVCNRHSSTTDGQGSAGEGGVGCQCRCRRQENPCSPASAPHLYSPWTTTRDPRRQPVWLGAGSVPAQGFLLMGSGCGCGECGLWDGGSAVANVVN